MKPILSTRIIGNTTITTELLLKRLGAITAKVWVHFVQLRDYGASQGNEYALNGEVHPLLSNVSTRLQLTTKTVEKALYRLKQLGLFGQTRRVFVSDVHNTPELTRVCFFQPIGRVHSNGTATVPSAVAQWVLSQARGGARKGAGRPPKHPKPVLKLVVNNGKVPPLFDCFGIQTGVVKQSNRGGLLREDKEKKLNLVFRKIPSVARSAPTGMLEKKATLKSSPVETATKPTNLATVTRLIPPTVSLNSLAPSPKGLDGHSTVLEFQAPSNPITVNPPTNLGTPMFKGRSTLKPLPVVCIPKPPTLSTVEPGLPSVRFCLNTFKSLVEQHTGKKCWALTKSFSVHDTDGELLTTRLQLSDEMLLEHKMYPSVLLATEKLRELKVSPVDWIKFAFKVWAYRGVSTEPTITFCLNVALIEKYFEWFAETHATEQQRMVTSEHEREIHRRQMKIIRLKNSSLPELEKQKRIDELERPLKELRVCAEKDVEQQLTQLKLKINRGVFVW